MTPARIASLAVVLVLTIVMVPLRADDGHLVNALIVWLIGSAALVAGAGTVMDHVHVSCLTSSPESLHHPPLSGAPSSLLEWVMPH